MNIIFRTISIIVVNQLSKYLWLFWNWPRVLCSPYLYLLYGLRNNFTIHFTKSFIFPKSTTPYKLQLSSNLKQLASWVCCQTNGYHRCHSFSFQQLAESLICLHLHPVHDFLYVSGCVKFDLKDLPRTRLFQT